MQGREAWARATLHSHTAFNETVTLLATAHELQEFEGGGGGWEADRGEAVKDSAGGGEGGGMGGGRRRIGVGLRGG